MIFELTNNNNFIKPFQIGKKWFIIICNKFRTIKNNGKILNITFNSFQIDENDIKINKVIFTIPEINSYIILNNPLITYW